MHLGQLTRASWPQQGCRLLLWALLGVVLAGWAPSARSATNIVTPSPKELERSIRRGVQFLVHSQNRDGSWGSARKTKDLNIYAPAPGAHLAYRSAVTALCVEALIETGAADQDTEAKRALQRGEAWLLDHLPKLRRADSIELEWPTFYNVWGHAYGLQALADMYHRESKDPQRRQRIQEVIQSQVDLLRRYASIDGGWSYYDMRGQFQRPATYSFSFVTATVLIAFDDAKKTGIEIPQGLAKRALASLERQRKKDNSYLYGEYLKWRPMLPINRPAGSLGRSQACNLALRVWGDQTITDNVLTDWLDRLIERNGWLSIGRKRPVPHESWFQVAGYFYYYGHYYAARCLDQLTAERARPYREHLAGILLPLQEKDGSWWDYPLYDYHQPYGTAFALMSLARCRHPVSR